MSGPYTPKPMEAARSDEETRGARDARIDGLRAEASEAIGYSANTIRAVNQRYRTAYAEEHARWQALRDELDAIERRQIDASRPSLSVVGDDTAANEAAEAAEAGAEDARQRALQAEVNAVEVELGEEQTELAKLEIAMRNLESIWLFLKRGDTSLVNETSSTAADLIPTDVQMRIIEAQELERSRLAQEVHDGPAQSLTNAIFQVEYIERVLDTDPRLAATELRHLRGLLRRELGDMRLFISQLRPPLLDEVGLDAAIVDAVEHARTVSGLTITTFLDGPADGLSEAGRTVVLRVAQEALQNVHKHASATNVTISTSVDDEGFVLEIRDDGRGFDSEAVAAQGRRHFGLQFMRERAELIGARLDLRSRPDGGTVVRLAIPNDGATGVEESR